MKGPGILKGIVIAIVASLAAGFLTRILPLMFSGFTSSSLIILTLSLGYLVFLLKHADTKRGRVVLMALWILLSLGGLFFGISLIGLIVLQLAIIWVLRSLYFHASIFAAVLDLILIIMAAGAGVWTVLQTGSLMAAVWSFFLCQSLFGSIPEFSNKQNPQTQTSRGKNDRFQSAHRIAQAAVRKLSLN